MGGVLVVDATAASVNTGPTVLVSGDVTFDWILAREPTGEPTVGAVAKAPAQPGGATRLADLIEAVVTASNPGPPPRVVRAGDTTPEPAPSDAGLNHTFALCSRFPAEASSPAARLVWRVESSLGTDRARGTEAVESAWRQLRAGASDARVIVLDDAGLGFRDGSDVELWRGIRTEPRPWVVLRQFDPVTTGPLWEHLHAEVADRLVVVLTIDDLREREVQVSCGLSWERTAQDLLWELIHKPGLNALSHVAHVVVSFGPEGVFHLSQGGPDSAAPTGLLFFDPERVEGTWQAQHPGMVAGGTDCLVAAVVLEILREPRDPDVSRAIQSGIAAARRLHLEGYHVTGSGRFGLRFPVEVVVEELLADREPLQPVTVPDPAADDRYWTILQDQHSGALRRTAAQIARYGPELVLHGVPLGRFDSLVTVDRSEMEAFRSVAALIAEYVRNPHPRPLSIGVFGPPGAGKSFGVKQVARSVASGAVRGTLEFNLPQLHSPADLVDAFHLVRDEALAGGIPLVFWDEFDASLGGEALGWLRYFLAPMQDGEFRHGQQTHPIGRSIFVFAGGTCASVEKFAEAARTPAGRGAKAPDFVSRLKGFVNVLGPNPRGSDDPYYVIRRAILLRSVLQRAAPQLAAEDGLRIDTGVLRAFLETTEYRHGARSLEAVIGMSRLAGASGYERSSLPPEPQLDLHVDARDFLALVQRLELEGELLERLARAAHEIYCGELAARGYVFGAVADDKHKVSDSLVDYADLSEAKKEQNRRNVRDIPTKLAAVGCVMVPARPGLPPFSFADDEVEAFAREEHERWMRDLGPGWRHGERTDHAARVHEALLPWERLSERQREKDRDFVRNIPRIIHEAGYAVVRTRGSREGEP